jgi:hypothetical protein
MRVGDYVQLTSCIDLEWDHFETGERGDVVRVTPEGSAMVHFLNRDEFVEVYPHEVSVLIKGE